MTRHFGRKCLLARRLVERGVRFVQIYSGHGNEQWDAHSDIEENHAQLCRETDRPIAGLLTDLKRRGLLDETLVIWGGEFGRTADRREKGGRPRPQPPRLHHLDGRRRRQGRRRPRRDRRGRPTRPSSDRVHVHDLHATILHLLGLDHTRLTYRHNGRDFRLTDVAGKVVATSSPE